MKPIDFSGKTAVITGAASGMAAMRTQVGRAAAPEEVSDYILYLASENGAFVTGSNHVIDGGRLAMVPQ